LSANSPPLAVVLGCAGTSLTDAERRFFEQANPLGFILFARNIETPGQVKALVASLRASVGRDDAPVMIDQEGGRVQRLKPPRWRAAPPAAQLGAIPDIDMAAEAVRLNAILIGDELRALGIDVDCAPVLDVPVDGAHDIIGDRALSHSPERVGILGRAACEGFLAAGVMPVIKHIPGHGRAKADSHLELPVVTATAEELELSDFVPFEALQDAAWAMTAHVVYTAYDDKRPATLSPVVVSDVIRRHIGFSGLLISDDLSMKALQGSFDERCREALEAGCDVALHCNGDMAEMQAVVKGARPMNDKAMSRFARAHAYLAQDPMPADPKSLDRLLAKLA
jgi:beta-N-acetylhexosaminidase